ncbi:hypothetical protein RJT34_25587 [Clitoria ternatea]|uniref:Inner centromere protein ARK-binding domain-containing protein n=1 Tax=Clitoria ternatea TaxID=43366 RepID=A0AAN9IGZ9_CLITE
MIGSKLGFLFGSGIDRELSAKGSLYVKRIGATPAMEKHVVQIFERTKRIIDQSREQCHLWEHHLFSKLILNGIPPPQWLCNSSLHSLPQGLNKNEVVSEVLLSQPRFGVPFPGRHCSLYSNVDAVSDAVQYPIGMLNEGRGLVNDHNTGDGLSNLPDCSVNNVGCGSSGPAELDSSAVSPQNQVEPGVSDSHHDLALSLAKLQRSKSRQKALELRNSAKAPKRRSGGDDNAGVCAGMVTGSASSTRQEEHVIESDVVLKDFNSNVKSGSMAEMARHDCVSQKENKSGYSGRITRSRSSSQKSNSSNGARSSVVKEDDPLPNNFKESLEIVNRNGSSGVREVSKGEYQSKEDGRSGYEGRLTRSRSSSQARYSELLKLDGTLCGGKGVEIGDLAQPCKQPELTGLCKASDCNDGGRRDTVKAGDFVHGKQESNNHAWIELLGSPCPPPGDDFVVTVDSVKSIDKSVPTSQPLISQNSQDPVVFIAGSFSSQKDPGRGAVETKELLSRSGSGKAYISRDSTSQNHVEVSQSSRSNFSEQRATSSQSGGKKSRNVLSTEMGARRLTPSPKYSKLDMEIIRDSAERENIAAPASRKSRAATICADEGSLRPVSSSNLDGRSLHAKSVDTETAVGEKVLDAQENRLSCAIPTDNVELRSAATIGEADADFGGLADKDPSGVSPKGVLNVSALKLSSDFIMSMMPKQLDFDDVEETSMNGIFCSPDLKEGQQQMSPEEEPLNSLEPVNLLADETSLVRQSKCTSSEEMYSLEMNEALNREEGPQAEYYASHFEAEDTARPVLNAISPNKEIPMVQNECRIFTTSLMNHSSPSPVESKNSQGSLSKEAMESKFVSVNSKLKNEKNSKLVDSSSEAITENGLHRYGDDNATNFTVGFPFAAPMDDVNVGVAQQAPNSIFSCQDGGLLRQALLSDGKIHGFSTDCLIFRRSTDSFTHDVEHTCPQHKRRKIDIETEKFPSTSTNLLEQPSDSIAQRPASRSSSMEEDSPEVVPEIQHLPSDQEDAIQHQFVSNDPMDQLQDNGECQTMEGSSLDVRKEEKLILDGRDRSADALLLEEVLLSGFSVDSMMRCTVDEKVELCHHPVNCGQESAKVLPSVERNTSSRRTCSGGNAKMSDSMSISPGAQCLDLISTDEALPEFEGFIMETDNAQPCIEEDQMELEKMNIPINMIDYKSLGKSRFMYSPSCYSSTPYKLHNIHELYHSLPDGLQESLDLRTSPPVNDGSPRSLSDCQPNSKGHFTSSVQTLWDRINSNFGSSGKRKSLKPELPCISEENENVDETAGTFQRDIGSEGMTGSIMREPLAEVIDIANPSTSAFQDGILTGRREDSISAEFDISGTNNKVKNKLDKQDGNRRRFMSKGKENHNISLGANGEKKTTESVRKGTIRPKLTGKDSMKRQGNNIVSNVSSFIPLVQQKQAAAVHTGKTRDIKVKALEAAEAAKRKAEKIENERKMKKEALKEKLVQQNLRLQEVQNKQKEVERKKKDAQAAAKKRQREDEEKKEKERKKKRFNDTKQQEHEKIRAKKEETGTQCLATGEHVQQNKKNMIERENHKNLQVQDKGESKVEKISETRPSVIRDSANDKTKEPEYAESAHDCANNGKVMGNLIKATEGDDMIIGSSHQEQSYEISPYKGSDDEDEDEDDIPNKKFIPSWASKHSLSLFVSSQKMDPETIFPRQSFCDIAEDFRRASSRMKDVATKMIIMYFDTSSNLQLIMIPFWEGRVILYS